MTQKLRQKIMPLMGTVILSLMLLPSAAFAATAEDSRSLENFIGEWQSNGDAFGQPAISTIKFTAAFGEKLVHIQYAITTLTNGTPSPAFSGVAYYKQLSDNRYQAFWADSEGSILPITANLEDKALTAIWGGQGGRHGRTRYEIIDDNKMRITDWVRRNNAWQQFNDNIYDRLDSTATQEVK